jgi:hypothetical protein
MLENNNLHIDSTGWLEEERSGKSCLVSPAIADLPKGAVTEYTDGDYKGEQLFSYDAGMYWANQQGKQLPDIEQLYEWIKKHKNDKDLKFAGYRHTDGHFYHIADVLNLWSAEALSCYLNSFGSFDRNEVIQQFGFSVRCLQDSSTPLSIEDRVRRLEDSAELAMPVNNIDRIFDSFRLEGKISQVHAEEIRAIIKNEIALAEDEWHKKGWDDGVEDCIIRSISYISNAYPIRTTDLEKLLKSLKSK